MTIKITCGNDLGEGDKDLIHKISDEFYPKIERVLKDISSFDVHVKCSKKDGNVKRYIINAKIIAPKNIFDIETEGYNLAKAVREVFVKILSSIESKCHTSTYHGVHGKDLRKC